MLCIRYLLRYSMGMNARWQGALWLLACAGVHAAPADASPLAAEIEQRARAALVAELPAGLAAELRLSLQLVAAREGARGDCPAGWQIRQALSFTHFRRIAVPVQCGDLAGSVVARLQVQAPVWVLQQAQPAGHRLVADDLRRELREVHTLAELTAAADPVGLPLRRSLRAGDPLRPADIERPLLVKRGDAVELVAAADGVAVSVAAVALAPGRLGEVVSVRNPRTQRVVKGRVAAPGVVEALGGEGPTNRPLSEWKPPSPA